MRRIVALFERDDEGWWVASVPNIKGCHTQGRSIRQARERLREALSLFVNDVDSVELVEDLRLPAPAKRALARHTSARRKAERELQKAQDSTVEAVKTLTEDLNLSVRDAGEILGLSHQRIQQLASARRSSRCKTPDRQRAKG